MTLSVADIIKKIQEGQDLEAISLSLISKAEQVLLQCCAVVRTFDENLVDTYFRPNVPDADKEKIPFDKLTSHGFVQRVPRSDGEYFLQPAMQKKYYDAWWESADDSPDFPRSETPPALRTLSLGLFDHYYRLGDEGKLDLVAQQVFWDKDQACDLFEDLYAAADDAFDLARCRDIINVLNGRENVLGHEFSRALNDRDRYLKSRTLWATEYYQTVSYYERQELAEEFESFLANSSEYKPKGKWILQLHAPGGMGKTMFVRWLISRRCVPQPHTIPCARVDFDFVDRTTASQHRWLLFLRMARELDVQIPGNVFSSLISKFTEYELILNHAQEQQTTSPVTAELPPPEKLEEEILYLFGKALKDANLAKAIIIIFDTLEEVILYHPDDLKELVGQIETVRETVSDVRLILSGRYDLTGDDSGTSSRLEEFRKKFEDFMWTIRVKPFADKEALGFLQEKKGLTPDRPLNIVVKRSEGNPFKLALFADILLNDPDITAETIRDYPSADLLYLIERVLSRIPNKALHWLLRYGVVPRKLTRSFVAGVMKKYLLQAISGDASYDDPSRYELSEKAQETVQKKEIFSRNSQSQVQDINVDELWTELQQYAAEFAWVTMEPADPDTAKFHGDVVNPMRRWLEKEPVYKLLHQDAITYFENKAKTDPGDWAKWMQNAVYHKFQLEGAAAIEYWRQLMAGEEDASRRRDLANDIVGLDYVDDNSKPHLLLNGQQIITTAGLVEAYYELARACVGMARAGNVTANDPLWSDADHDLQRSEELQKEVPDVVISAADVAAVRAAILTSRGLGDQTIALVEDALLKNPGDRARLRLETELANALASQRNYQEASLHWRNALERAEHLGASPKFIVETRRRLALLHWDEQNFVASAGELDKALSLVPPDDSKTQIEIMIELVNVYFDMGQFSQAREMFEKLHSLEESTTLGQLRYCNYMVRFLVASGDLLKALEFNSRTGSIIGSSLTNSVADESRNAFDLLVVESHEQLGMLRGLLFEFEASREALEKARSHWRELGNSKAARRCMLKKAEVFLKQAGEVKEATVVLVEASRLTIDYDPEHWLEERLIDLEISHLRNELAKVAESLGLLERRAADEKWKPLLLAKLKLRIGKWKLLPNNGDASSEFFSDLASVLRQIEPPSARMLLLDPLSEYPTCTKVSRKVAEDLISLFPLQQDDDDFHINAPRVAEVLRVLGRKTETLTLLKRLLKDDDVEDRTYALRRALLTHVRNSQIKGSQKLIRRLVEKFLDEFKDFPVLCASTLVELAELLFATDTKSDLRELLDRAELLLEEKGFDSQWMMRLVALRARLSVERNPKKALEDARLALSMARSLGNDYEVLILTDFIANEKLIKRPASAEATGKDAFSLRPDEDDIDEVTRASAAAPRLGRLSNTTTIQIEGNWVDSVTIKTKAPVGEVATRRLPIEPESQLERLLAFESYENFSFSFLRQMDNDWITACKGLGEILLDEKQAQQLQPADGKVSALCLIIDALQLSSAPWELMVLPSQLDGPASISSALNYFYRATIPYAPTLIAETTWLQSALSRLGNQKLEADGFYGPKTKATVKDFQAAHNLPTHGSFDGKTRRAIKNELYAQSRRDRPRVLMLRPSIERQRAISRGHQALGLSTEDTYRREKFKDLLIVEDPYVEKVEAFLKDFEPDVIHIFPTMEESTSIGIYLDFGSGGTGVMPPSKASMKSSRPRISAVPTGDIQFFTLTALAEMMKKIQRKDRPRPLLILDVLEPPGMTDLFTQLFLRNAFAAQLYPLGHFESIIATGLTPAEMQEEMSRTLISALGSFEAVGEIVNRLRRVADVGSYTHLPDVGSHRGPLRDPSDRRYLSAVAATAGTALFTQDPEM